MQASPTPDTEALRFLIGEPNIDPQELRSRLRVSPETFLAAWNGDRTLPPAARRRLFSILAEEVARLERLVRVLAHATKPEVPAPDGER